VDDDVIRLQALNINATDDDGIHSQHRIAGSAVDLQLDRMLEEHTTFQVANLYAFTLSFSFFALERISLPFSLPFQEAYADSFQRAVMPPAIRRTPSSSTS